jgi:hypothetical protein
LFAGQQNLFYKNKKLETDEGLLEVGKTSVSPLLMSQQAAARGDYRQAIRYQYLYILHLMGEKRMVNLQPQKTNYQYLQEIKQKPFAGEFGTLTLQFEYVWYGEFNLNLAQYDAIAGGYRKFIASWL